MKRIFFTLFATVALAALGYGQERQETVRKLIKLEHSNASDVGKLLPWIPNFPSNVLETILVQGTPEEVAKAEEIIREVDQPREVNVAEGSVELDAYFVSAGAEASGGAVPPLIQPVITELQRRFTYDHYGLLDSALVQVLIGRKASVEGQFKGTLELPTSYSFEVNPTGVSGEAGKRIIRLNELRAVWNMPYRTQVSNMETGQTTLQTLNRELRIETNVSVPEGKLVVVGKAGSPTSAQAIFLVLRARLVE